MIWTYRKDRVEKRDGATLQWFVPHFSFRSKEKELAYKIAERDQLLVRHRFFGRGFAKTVLPDGTLRLLRKNKKKTVPKLYKTSKKTTKRREDYMAKWRSKEQKRRDQDKKVKVA